MKLGFAIKWDTAYLAQHPCMIPTLIGIITTGALLVTWKIIHAPMTSYWLMGFLIGLLLSQILLFFTVYACKKANKKQINTLQTQLIEKDRLASLGLLSAGIAHEIKNPLNFINNFSQISLELLNELKNDIHKIIAEHPTLSLVDDELSINQLIADLSLHATKINEHGKRAENIVKNMLLQSRKQESEKTPTEINKLIEEYTNLAYHALRAQDSNFNITFNKTLDPNLGTILAIPQSIGQVLLNLINNACYAAYDKKKNSTNLPNNFTPTLSLSTTRNEAANQIEIHIKDNGNGIPDTIRENLFKPFYTTKPNGVGTGLGLFISHDIITKQHHGELKVNSMPGEYTEFIIILPIK